MRLRKLFLTLSIILSAGCNGQLNKDENLSADVESIEALCTVGSYQINITSDCSWTASVTSEDGQEISWATLSRTKGTGDSQITVRVFENKYNADRKAQVSIVSDGGVKVEVSLLQKANSAGGDNTKASMRLGTYNLRVVSADASDADNKWSVRKDRLQQSILDNDFDVFGINEVSSDIQTWFKSTAALSNVYSTYIFSPYAQNGIGDRAQGIAYKTAKFTLESSGYFWTSDTPDICSVNDTGSAGNYRRGGCWAIFKHKDSGVRFFFMCTHGCLNSDVNAKFAYVYEQQEKLHNLDNLPSFFVGDLNARPEYEASTTFKTYWSDTYLVIDSSKRTGCVNTYNGYSNTNGKYRIDYVYFRGSGVTPTAYCCNNTLYGGLYASDHFPVWADFDVQL